MRVIITTSVAPAEVLRFDIEPQRDSNSLLHRDLPKDIFLVHPDTYSELIDRLGPLEEAGITVEDLTTDERAETRRIFARLEARIRAGQLVPGRD